MRLSICTLIFLLAFGVSCKHKEKQSSAAKTKIAKKEKKRAQLQSHEHEEKHAEAYTALRKAGFGEKEIKQERLLSFISEWYGAPYKYSGCQKSGVDCSCFANILYEQVYGKKISRTASDMYKECDKLSPADAQEGDLFFFRIGGNSITHVGVYLRNNYFIHASTSKGVMINSISEAYYQKYFYCAGRLRNV
jgi:cell wall-associated NlpC family hydrolase